MRALMWHGKYDLRLEDVREPRCGDGEALLEVKYAGICGSDLTIYQGKHKRAKPPTILGSCVYTPADFAKSVGLVAEKQVDLLPLVSHRMPLAEGIGAVEQLTKGMNAQKVLLAVS